MEKSWSPPVAQTLQRHTGSWKLSPPLQTGEAALPVAVPPAHATNDAAADLALAPANLSAETASCAS
jgi:hypothetical protein